MSNGYARYDVNQKKRKWMGQVHVCWPEKARGSTMWCETQRCTALAQPRHILYVPMDAYTSGGGGG